MEEYNMTLDCKNCGHSNEVTIPKGVLIENFLKMASSKITDIDNKWNVCEYCGCNIITPFEEY